LAVRHTVVMGSRRTVGIALPDARDGLPARIAFLVAKARFQIELLSVALRSHEYLI